MSDGFILGQGQGHELETAFGRNGWTNADVKALCKGDTLASHLAALRGTYQIVAKPDPMFVEHRRIELVEPVGKFNAKERFSGEQIDVTGAFEEYFFGMSREMRGATTTLTSAVLGREVTDTELISNLVGTPETTPIELWSLSKIQTQQELIKEDRWLFFMRDDDEALRVVSATWIEHLQKWILDANSELSYEFFNRQPKGTRVFWHNN